MTGAIPPRYRVALAALGGLLLVASPLWAPLLLRRLAFFRVRKVEIIGTHYVAVNDILERLHVDTTASVWDPTGPLARRVAAHPQVREVHVHRKLPGTLVVEISENLPVALVPTAQGFRAYDARGVALPLDLARTPVDAPILVQRDTALLRLLAGVHRRMPALYDRVSEVRRVGPDELLFQLASVPVRTMRDVSVERLGDIEPVEEDLARRQLRPAEIDLRYRDQVIARLP
ncbi:MAG TPA: FtsQ-type POTRA domain-containing protein [Gemmatimonadaceae bacterium]|nr:FtsQ-type POTRA domain-containing protein [Gemmatimonadaceae bacterium]